MYYSDIVSEQLKNKQIDSTDIVYVLTEGDVDFGKSDTKSISCKTYYVAGEIKNKKTILKIKNCLDKALVEEVVKLE